MMKTVSYRFRDICNAQKGAQIYTKRDGRATPFSLIFYLMAFEPKNVGDLCKIGPSHFASQAAPLKHV
mgnify:CR=1 FL=1